MSRSTGHVEVITKCRRVKSSRVESLEPRTLLSSAPPNITHVNQVDGVAHDVASVGGYAYACVGARLRIFDVSNVAAPVAVGDLMLPGVANDVFVAGGVAYVVASAAGLQIVNVGVPSAPSIVGSVDTPGTASAVVVASGRAYVADGTSGLQIIDVTNPALPVMLGNYPTTAVTQAVGVSGSRVYAGDSGAVNRVRILNVSNPATPALLGTVATGGVMDLAVMGTYVYVASYQRGLEVIDASDPSSAAIRGQFLGTYSSVAVTADGFVELGGYGVLDVLGMYSSTSFFQTSRNTNVGNAEALFPLKVANQLYILCADAQRGIETFALGWDGRTSLIHTTPTGSEMYAVARWGNLVIAAEEAAGIIVYDASNRLAPRAIGTFDTPGVAYDVQVVGNLAYVADGYSGLEILDISNPSQPWLVGQYDTINSTQEVAVSGNYVYLGRDGVDVINVSNPASPQRVGQINEVNFRPFTVAALDHYLYATDDAKLRVYDVANPASPALATSVTLSGLLLDITFSGNLAYLAAWDAGLIIMSVSNPGAPTYLSTLDTSGFAYGVDVSGGVALLADLNGGLKMIDATVATAPKLVASAAMPADAMGVVVSNGVAYVANRDAGLAICTFDRSAIPVPPAATSVSFQYDTSQAVVMTFDQDVSGSVNGTDLQITNLTTSQTFTAGYMTVSTSQTTPTRVKWAMFPWATLPDGNYRARLPVGSITNASGVPMSAEFAYDFFVLAGDANRDRHVDDADQAILTAHLGQSGAFAQGDFNYDGTIDAADQAILTANWHIWLVPPGDLALPATAGNDFVTGKLTGPNTLELFYGSPVPAVPTYRVLLGGVSSISFDGGTGTDTFSVVGTPNAETVVLTRYSLTFGPLNVSTLFVERVNIDGAGGFDDVTVTAGATAKFTGTQRLNSLTIGGLVTAVPSSGSQLAIRTCSLSLTDTAGLDLGTSNLIVDYTGASPIPQVEWLVWYAHYDGAWSPIQGLTSSGAATNPKQNTTLGVMESSAYKAIVQNANATFSGEPIDDTAVLVKYTYCGDANFDGRVSFDDYVRIDTGFNAHRTGWVNGDFNLDGAVNFDDYVLIDTAFNTQGGALGRDNVGRSNSPRQPGLTRSPSARLR